MTNEESLTQRIAPNSPVQIFLKKYGASVRTLGFIIVWLSFLLASYHLFSAYFGQPDSRLHRSFHLTLILVLSFVFFPLGRKSWDSPLNIFFLVDFILIALSIMIQVYTNWDFSDFLQRDPTRLDVMMGGICFFLILEATRRTIGWILAIISGFFLFQTLYSDMLFGILYGPPMPWPTTVDFLFKQSVGVFGVALGAMASYIILFIFFGSILVQSGAGNFFIDLANSLTGHRVGGPAKVAIFSSAIFGTLSGSAVANVVTTGSFTIPLMKKIGYEPKFAGAVESVASCGGQIMPPIMGASAFIMAEFLGIPYLSVAIGAIIPAVLYFFSVFVMVDLEARKKGFLVLKKEELPKLGKVLKRGGHLIIPLLIIILLLVAGYTVMMAGFGAILSTFLLIMTKKETRMVPLQFLESFVKAARAAIPVAMACASAGLIVGSLEISGLGIRFSSLILDSSGGILLLALIFCALASIILGMGLPTVSIYITLSALVVPALMKMGVYPLAAHMFVFYFGVLAFVTPPVCAAAYAAAGIAGSNPMQTGFMATRLGIAGFLVPFMFIYNHQLLFVGPIWSTLWAGISAVIGVTSLGCGIQGWILGKVNHLERLFLIAAALLLIKPGIITDAAGFMILALILLRHTLKRRKKI